MNLFIYLESLNQQKPAGIYLSVDPAEIQAVLWKHGTKLNFQQLSFEYGKNIVLRAYKIQELSPQGPGNPANPAEILPSKS